MSFSSRIIVLLLVAIGLYIYVRRVDRDWSRAAFTTFHLQYNASDFAVMHQGATPAFRARGAEAEFVKSMQTLRRVLGKYLRTTRETSDFKPTLKGTFVTLTHLSEFEHGLAEETFTCLIGGEKALLDEYRIIPQGAPAPIPAPPEMVPRSDGPDIPLRLNFPPQVELIPLKKKDGPTRPVELPPTMVMPQRITD